MWCLIGDCPTGVDKSVTDHYRPTGNVFIAEWDVYGKAAGPIRNKAMIDKADALIAFWDGDSRGTKDCIKHATHKGIPVLIIPIIK